MVNDLMGEIEAELNGITYKLRLNVNVIKSYCNKSGFDFFTDMYAAVDAAQKAGSIKKDPARYAAVMCNAVSITKSAWLFYLAAKECNSNVEFGEIQEALIVDHDLTNENKFHPALFLSLCLFAFNGKGEEDKKKDSSQPG